MVFDAKGWAAVALALALSACSSDTVTFVAGRLDSGVTVTGYLALPDVYEGPVPAVVLLHGCSGLELDRDGVPFRGLRAHQDALVSTGFAALIVDSWGSRGISTAEAYATKCQGRFSTERQLDLTGAIRYLRGLRAVNGRVGVLGFSQGGRTAIEATGWTPSALRRQIPAAVVAVYPSCRTAPKDVRVPLLILIGDADGITRAVPCRQWVERYARTRPFADTVPDTKPVPLPDLIVYPGVHHGFDLPIQGAAQTPLGTVRADHRALADARRRMIAFFKTHLAD